MEKKNLPVYRLVIDESDTEKPRVNYIALVDQPATMSNWMTFKKQFQFVEHPTEKMVLTGAFMVADLPIYRKDAERGEYYVIFSKEEIYKIVKKFFRNSYGKNFNIMHDPTAKADGVYIIESFIVDEARGLSAPKGLTGITDGSWVGSVKVDNQLLWDNFIKTGQLEGFSVEGFFDQELIAEQPVDDIEKIVEEIKAIEE